MRGIAFGAMILWLMVLGGVAHSLTMSSRGPDEPELALADPSLVGVQSDLGLFQTDLDQDGVIGGRDFAQFRSCMHDAQTALCTTADFDGDAVIGAGDLALLGRAIGAIQISAIPEPGTLLLAATGLTALGWLRSRI